MDASTRPGAGRTVLVTGASSGIGAATARLFAAEGWTVGLAARRADRLDEVLEECRATSPRSCRWPVDLSAPRAAAAFACEVWDEFGHLDAVVNNAGVPMRRRIGELTMDDVERTMAVNYLSPVAITLAILPRMVARGSGCIVNVSSLAGRLGVATESAYCGSKFALAGFTEAAAAELASSGVRIRLVLPGAIDTEIWDQPGNDPPLYTGPLFPADGVARGIVDSIDARSVEHYLPDMKAVVEMKTSDIDTFIEGMRAMQQTQMDADAADGAPPSPPVTA